MKPSRDINRAKAGTPMNPITATGETLVRFVRPEERREFTQAWRELLASRLDDPAAAISKIVKPRIRWECVDEFDRLMDRLRRAARTR